MDEKTLSELLMDPLRLVIAFQVMKSGEITAKSIGKNLGKPRNTVYYHLKKLKKTGIVDYREELIPDKHFPRRIYRISDEFIALKQKQEKSSQNKGKISPRLIQLANLYEASALIMEAGTFVSKQTNSEFNKQVQHAPMVTETYLLREEEYQEALESLQELLQDLYARSEANAQHLIKQQKGSTGFRPRYHFLSVIGIPPLSP